MAEGLIDNTKYLLTSCLTVLSQMSLGQVLLRVLDRGFWIIEKSAQWSLPYHESVTEENGKFFQSMELVRPLPWVLFLPGLILLRLFRLEWNVGALVFGYPTIEPSDIVKYVQKTRRRLRSIKANGIKTQRQKRGANSRPLETSLQEANRSLIKSIQLTLSSLSCLDNSKSNHSPPPTRIQVSVNHEMSVTSDEKSATESTITAFRTIDQKRKYAQISSDDEETDESEEENLNSKIERLARESSIDDEDFEPEESSDNEKSSETDEEDEEEKISDHEVNDLIQENKKSLATHKFLFSNSIKHTDNDSQDMCPTNNKQNPEIELMEEQREYFSPLSGDDGEAAFYSPISSKSSSPERVLRTFKGHEENYQATGTETVNHNYDADVDTKVIEKSNGRAETSGSIPIINPNKCAPKFQHKSYHHKGRRMSHGCRKKK